MSYITLAPSWLEIEEATLAVRLQLLYILSQQDSTREQSPLAERLCRHHVISSTPSGDHAAAETIFHGRDGARLRAPARAADDAPPDDAAQARRHDARVHAPGRRRAQDAQARPDPTDAEIEDFYNKVKSQTNGATLEEIKPQLIMSLKNQQSQEKVMTYIDSIKVKYEIKISLPFPDAARVEVSADDDPFIGPKDAPITIVQFAEFQCPYCGKAGESVDQVMKEYEGKIKMVYRDFPLNFHDRAIPAAVAANCSGEQGKYWEMYDLLMSNQRALSDSDLTAHATSLGLDLDKWNTCRQDPKQAAEVQKDLEDGQKVGVSGTPAFFINGVMLSGAVPFAQFKEIIDRELGL